MVVANPTAGGGKAGKLIGRADEILHSLRIAHQVRVTESPADMESTARQAAEDGAPVVAVLGGDGTVSCAANGVLGTGAALAVLPAGTGDDFAKAIGAAKFGAAVRLLANPKIRAIDVVRVTAGNVTRHFVNVAGAGFDSEVNETANAMTLRLGGTGTYVVALMKTLARFTPAHYELRVDDQTLEVDYASWARCPSRRSCGRSHACSPGRTRPTRTCRCSAHATWRWQPTAPCRSTPTANAWASSR